MPIILSDKLSTAMVIPCHCALALQPPGLGQTETAVNVGKNYRKLNQNPSAGGQVRMIGIGGHLAMPPLPHHRAYGSVPRRFDWVKLGRRRGVGADRVSGNSGCAGLVGPPGVRTCAKM